MIDNKTQVLPPCTCIVPARSSHPAPFHSLLLLLLHCLFLLLSLVPLFMFLFRFSYSLRCFFTSLYLFLLHRLRCIVTLFYSRSLSTSSSSFYVPSIFFLSIPICIFITVSISSFITVGSLTFSFLFHATFITSHISHDANGLFECNIMIIKLYISKDKVLTLKLIVLYRI